MSKITYRKSRIVPLLLTREKMTNVKRNVLNLGKSTTIVEALEGLTVDEAVEFVSESKDGRDNIDDSFFICDLGDVVEKWRKWHELLPRVSPYYAVKAAPYGPMIGCLSEMGAGFDCASMREINLAMEWGVAPEGIVFAHRSKQISHILHAKKHGIKKTVFDTEAELHKIKMHFPRAELILRIRTKISSAFYDLGRFGAEFQEACRLLKLAKTLDLCVIGISFHVGSSCRNHLEFAKALSDVKKLFDFAKTLGISFSVLDIGGGFPGGSEEYFMEKIVATVNRSLDGLFPIERYNSVRVIAEPGRYFAATAFTLATNVIHKTVPSPDDDVKKEYTINEGKYGSLNRVFHNVPGEFGAYVLKRTENDYLPSRICGPTCDASDVVVNNILLPELQIGDWILWRNAGCYSFALATDFNGFRVRAFYNIISAKNANILQLLRSAKEKA